MLEGSGRVVQLALAQFRLGGLDVQQLTSGLRTVNPDSDLAFADWNDLVLVFERAKEAANGGENIRQMCEATIPSALPEAVGLMNLAPDLVLGSQLINTYADSTFFANVRYPTMRRTGARSLHLRLRIPQHRGYRDCPAFFEAMVGVLRASSIFAGFPPATVETQTQPFGAEYHVTLPAVEHEPLPSVERTLRERTFQHWQARVKGLRATMLQLRQTELRAQYSATFATLSQTVTGTLIAQEQRAMPAAAVAAIATTLGCCRVVLRKITVEAPAGITLAEYGPPVRGLLSFEAETPSALIVISADVVRGSAPAYALSRLAPWLALVFSAPAPEGPKPPRGSDWPSARLTELTARFRFTGRQAEVAWLMIQGHSNKAISLQLGCAERTAEQHAQAVLAKSRTGSRASLIALFYDDSAS